MVDLKELIKWFIPCFHILLSKRNFVDCRLAFLICLFLFFNSCHAFSPRLNSDSGLGQVRSVLGKSDNVFNLNNNDNNGINSALNASAAVENERSTEVSGRTFGRPFKKMMAGLLPIIFQLGAATTWAAVATLIGMKTLLVTMAILKLLLLAGAAKLGALFASKSHHHPKEQPWTPQKEIHLHIHNQGHEQHGHDDHFTSYGPSSPWSREGLPVAITPDVQPQQQQQLYAVNPYVGPQTIKTPYGNYVRIEKRRRKRDLTKNR